MGINKSNRSGIASQVDVLREKILDAVLLLPTPTETLVHRGKEMLALKEATKTNEEFAKALSVGGIKKREAYNAMRVALVFGVTNTPRAAIAKTGIGKTKLNLLARLDEVTLDLLASGGAYNDHTLDDILRMSARELQRVIQSGEDIICERTLTNKGDTPSLSVDDENDKEAEIKQSDKNEENKKQYCRELFRVALRYSGVTELDILTKSIEELIACSLADKYCPGLNAASYEVYNKFMINRRAAK
ncbi:hypothetical protein NEP02_06935 [Escherichia coli]|uniref:hypothetical protein n=1 Tax=Enterobacteriaceae TaxID=543 RepID=UPI0006CFFA88|nr:MULTISPECIES: hypothetical protein [Enterobacteriaceae]HEE9901400.1 hypothetical protein [Citrobacter freundii]ELQ5603906.1 hypothetical protein [Escherichia coli]KPO04120.1 hypothetical protein VM39_23820 [Escherichia coli]KPO13144.1 hypothetical protein ACU62_06635 [Escherichia coli]MBC6566462.1 hypothetical protein [Escherichia coli]